MSYEPFLTTTNVCKDLPGIANENWRKERFLNRGAKTASFTAFADDSTGVAKDAYECDATSGAIVVTLPAVATADTGRPVTVSKVDAGANTVTIDGNASELVGSATTLVLTRQYETVTIYNNGTRWVISSYESGGATPGAATAAQYVTLATDAALSSERVLTAGQGVSLTDAGAGSTVTIAVTPAMFGARYGMWMYEDWIAGVIGGVYAWQQTVSGAGAATGVSVTPIDSNHPGNAYCETGTTTTGRADLASGTNSLTMGGGILEFRWWVYLSALSDGTDTYTVRVGLGDSGTGDFSDGVYFEYTDAGGGGATPNWSRCTANGAARTKTAGSVAAAASAWTRLRAVVNAAGTSVEFFVNGTSIGSNTTNIPTGSALCAPRFHIIKSAGSTSRIIYADAFEMSQTFTTPR